MNDRPKKTLHWKDAAALLESGEPCTLKLWKMSTGDILVYKNAKCISHSFRRGTHRVRLPESNLIREFRDITCFEINEYEIYR